MRRSKTIVIQLLILTSLSLGSCSESLSDDPVAPAAEESFSDKIIFTPDHAVKGSLLVRFDAETADRIEAYVSQTTRSGGVATRSGLEPFDAATSQIGIVSLERLFPVEARFEADTRAAGLHRWYIVSFDEQTDLEAAARRLAAVSEVNHVEYNLQLQRIDSGHIEPSVEQVQPQTRADLPFNDPFLKNQWHYINTGDTDIYSQIKAGADVNCAEAWKLCTGDPNVIVAVIDDCVQWDHPDLEANMWTNPHPDAAYDNKDIHGWNFCSNRELTISTTDGGDHGTHVAGTIAAVNNNNKGGCGIAGGSGNNDGVKIMSCQIYHNGAGGTAAITAQAFKYAADHGAVIAQCSFGYPAKPDDKRPTTPITDDTTYASLYSVEKEAIDYFIARKNSAAIDGGLVIFAAGNESYGRSSYPGAYRQYISVTAMSCDYTPAYYTNYGPGCNIAAPGGDAYQAMMEKGSYKSQVYSTITGSGYGYSQGTSMACPHVSGVAALGLSYALKLGKQFTLDQFKAMLLTSVNDINAYCIGTKSNPEIGSISLTRYAKSMGTGYIDAFQLLMNVRGTTCLPITVGTQNSLDLNPYLGDGALNLKILSVEIAAADKTRLGITSEPTIFANKILLQCSKPGSAIIRIKLLAGMSQDGISGMEITREFALIARNSQSANGGWL